MAIKSYTCIEDVSTESCNHDNVVSRIRGMKGIEEIKPLEHTVF